MQKPPPWEYNEPDEGKPPQPPVTGDPDGFAAPPDDGSGPSSGALPDAPPDSDESPERSPPWVSEPAPPPPTSDDPPPPAPLPDDTGTNDEFWTYDSAPEEPLSVEATEDESSQSRSSRLPKVDLQGKLGRFKNFKRKGKADRIVESHPAAEPVSLVTDGAYDQAQQPEFEEPLSIAPSGEAFADAASPSTSFASVPEQPKRRRKQKASKAEQAQAAATQGTTKTPRAPKQARRLRPIKKARITVIDGVWTCVVSIRNNIVVNLEKTLHDSEDEAVSAAARRGGTVVWSSVEAHSIRAAAPKSAKATRLEDAGRAQTECGDDAFAVRDGEILFALPMSEKLKALTKKCSVHLSATARLPDRHEGYWLRIGDSHVEMGLVQDWQLIEWGILPNLGTGKARELIEANQPAPVVLSEQTRSLAAQFSSLRNQWMMRQASGETVYLHGPGAKWTAVDAAIRNVSSCLVVTPTVLEVAPDTTGDPSQIATAVLASQAPPIFATKNVLRKEKRKLLLEQWGLFVMAGILSVAIVIWSWTQGNAVRQRIEDATVRTTDAWLLEDTEGKQMATEALAFQTTLEIIKATDDFQWGNVLQHKRETLLAEGLGAVVIITEVVRCETLEVYEDVANLAAADAVEERMRQKAHDIYGEGSEAARITNPNAISFSEGMASIAYTLMPGGGCLTNDEAS